MKNKIFTLSLFFASLSIQAQTKFEKTFKLEGFDIEARAVQQTPDSGYIIAGTVKNYKKTDIRSKAFLMKTNSSGGVQWTKAFGDSLNYADANILQQTKDGGYMLGGYFQRYSYLLKVDKDGLPVFAKKFAEYNGRLGAAKVTSDGGFIVTGPPVYDGSYTGDNIYMIKYDAAGQVSWSKNYKTDNQDMSNDVQQTTDGGYVIVGTSGPNDLHGDKGIVVIKTNQSGDTLWCKTYGSEVRYEEGYSIQQTADGGYIIGGNSDYSNGYLLKLTSNGTLSWSRMINNIGQFGELKQARDGGYFAIGYQSFPRSVAFYKFSADGVLKWSKRYGTSGNINHSVAYGVQQTFDSGFIIAGEIDSTSYAPFSGYMGYLVKTDSLGTGTCSEPDANPEMYDLFLSTMPFTPVVTSSVYTNTFTTLAGTIAPVEKDLCKTVLSIDDKRPTGPAIMVSPNPFASTAIVKFNETVINASLAIYNTHGQIVKQVNNVSGTEIEIERENLQSGMYFISIKKGDQIIISDKFIIAD